MVAGVNEDNTARRSPSTPLFRGHAFSVPEGERERGENATQIEWHITVVRMIHQKSQKSTEMWSTTWDLRIVVQNKQTTKSARANSGKPSKGEGGYFVMCVA